MCTYSARFYNVHIRYPIMHFNSLIVWIQQVPDEAQRRGLFCSSVPLKNTSCATFNKGQQSNCWDASIASPRRVLLKQWTKSPSRAPCEVAEFLRSLCFSQPFVTLFRNEREGWNFIVYVFIHCEAGITAFTRSFKQLSEHSIDWNVNTGSDWAAATRLQVQQLSSSPFIVSWGECFFFFSSLNCWLRCSSIHQGLGILGNGEAENETLVLIVWFKTEGTFQGILN